MKKIIISMFLIIATVSTMLFAGCGGSKSEKKPEALAGNHDETTDLSSIEITNTKNSDVFLVRNDKTYQMDGTSNTSYALTLNPGNMSESRIISKKDIPIPIIQENDKIYCFWKDTEIKSVKFVGYGPLVVILDEKISVEENDQEELNPKSEYTELNIAAYDEKGDVIRKNLAPEGIVTNLKFGQKVVVNYKDATNQWRRYITSAKCSYYDLGEGWVEKSVKAPTTTDNNYTVYDPTKLDKGYYAIFKGTKIYSVFVVQ